MEAEGSQGVVGVTSYRRCKLHEHALQRQKWCRSGRPPAHVNRHACLHVCCPPQPCAHASMGVRMGCPEVCNRFTLHYEQKEASIQTD
eukprot:1159661-Pelagomonas_calceolata.AAC.2